MKTQSIILTAVVISALLAQITFAVLPRYEIIDLGSLGGRESRAFSVNDSGQVVGTSTAAIQVLHAFLWDQTQGMLDLGMLAGGGYSVGYGINDNGEVVGYSGSYYGRAFIWTSDSGMIDLGMLLGGGHSEAYGINNAGQVVGGWEGRAFLWHRDTGMLDLGRLASGDSIAYAINNVEQVVGASHSADGLFHAFIWDRAGGMRDLGTLGGDTSVAFAINNKGQVVGYSRYEPGNDWYNAFLWDDSNGMIDLSTRFSFGSYESLASAINDSGQIVGTLNPNGWAAPFYLDSNIGMIKLYDLLPANSGWEQLRNAASINNRGQIVGLGITDTWRAFLMTPIPPRTYYVDADATGANDGSSWADAYNDLQDALVIAERGDEIRVAQGIYKPAPPPPPPPPGPIPPPPPPPSNRTATFQLKKGVVIKGGYAGFGEPDPNARDIDAYKTILSGDLAGNDVDVNDISDLWDEPSRADNSYHVVTSSGTDETAMLDGFTIVGGNANDPWPDNHDEGGGLCNYMGAPTVINCTFIGNSAEYGGGMYSRSGRTKLTKCTFNGNSAKLFGGGIYYQDSNIPTLINCTFNENSAMSGGGICDCRSSLILTKCLFNRNSATSSGGGITNINSTTKLIQCTFSGNSALSGGVIDTDESILMITKCLFSSNSAIRGGVMHNSGGSVTLTNCTLSGNSAIYEGGVVYNKGGYITPAGVVEGGNLTLTNCTFAGNSAVDGSAIACDSMMQAFPSELQVTNCILWDGGNEIWNNDDSTISIMYSDVHDGFPGEGNIDANPRFADSGNWDPNGTPEDANDDFWIEGDYHLLPNSACIDAGDPNYVAEPNETDLGGRPRVIGGRIDMGAYESITPIPVEARIIPNTIKPTSKGKSITCYIWPPEDYNLANNDCLLLLLGYKIEPEQFWIDEEKQVIVARFSREKVQALLDVGEVELTISVHLTDGTIFEGRDVIRVTHTGGPKPDKFDEASNPNPDDGAKDVNTTAELSWTAGSYAQSHDIYFGTSIMPPFVCNQTSTAFDPGTMDYDTTYFWRIDEVNKWGKTTGFLWCFTTGPTPGMASNPSPTDGAIVVKPNADLSWSAGSGATSHDVYFGTNNPPPFVCNQTATMYDPGLMNYSTKYYWRIDEVNIWGKNAGNVWRFTTMMPPPTPP